MATFAEFTNKSKKKKENSFADYTETYLQEKANSDIDGYIDSFVKDANSFLTDSSENYSRVGFNNAKSEYATRDSQRKNLDSRAKRIRNFLEQNEVDETTKKKITDYLDAYDTDSLNVIDAFKSKSDYFSQWENEDAYNYWLQSEEEKKKYSAMSLADIEKEYAQIEAEEKAFKDTNGGKLINYLKKAGSYFSEGKAGKSGSAIRAQSEMNIDTIDDFTRKKEKLNIYRKQRATEELLGGLSDEQIGFLDDIGKADTDNETSEVLPAIGVDSMGMQGWADATEYERKAGTSSREKLLVQLKEKYPDKAESELYELINNMVELRKNQVNEEEQAKRDAEMKGTASDDPVSSFIISRGANILGGTTGLAELYLQRDNEYGYDTNAAGFMLTNDSNTIDEQIQLDHDWVVEIGDTEVDGFDLAYNIGTSVVDNVGRLAMSGGNKTVSSMMMFAQSTTQSIIDSKEKGYSDAKALTMGLLNGTFEALAEKISLDIILGSSGSALRKLAKSFVAEGGEEITSNWLNRIADEIANGKHSELSQMYEKYVREGSTKAQALTEVICSIIGEDFKTFLVGGLSGLVLGGAGTAIGSSLNTVAVNEAAKNMSESDIVALQEQARALGVDASDIDIGSAGPWGDAPSTKKVANLIGAVQEKQAQTDRQKVIDTAKSYGLNVSLYNTQTETGFNKLKKSVANIEREITARVNEQADNIYITALADRIEELGESRGKALYIADSYIRAVDGQSLDQYREASLNSEAAKIAINEFNSSGENTPQWVRAAQEQIENVYAEIERRYITPVHSDSKTKVVTKSNDNNNVKSNVESTEKGIDNVPKTQNVTQTPKTSAVVNGQSVEVEGIGNVGENGSTVIVNGKEVDIKNVTFDNPVTQAAYNFASGMETTEKAKAALELYNPKFDRGSDYNTAFNEYYNAGLKGIGSFNDVDKYYTFAHSFPVSWREAVFNAGRSNKVYKSGVNKLYKNRNLSKNQKSQLKVLDLLGKKYGVSFLVFDTLKDNNGTLNGLQIAGTNKVAVSLETDGKLYLRTAGHECFHVIEEWNPKAATELTEKVVNYLKQTEDYNYSEQVKRYAKTYGVDETTAEGLALIHSEMAADSMFDVFSNEKFIKDIVTENRTLAQKIKDFLTDLISELRQMISHFHESKEMNALRNQTKVLEDINASFISALETATQTMHETLSDKTKNTATKSGVRYSFAGVKSKSHSWSLLEQAYRLEDVGKISSEEIRQQTGWFRGYDGKWRYEISDRDMEIDTRGKFSSNPDIKRYTELVDKVYFDMTATETEIEELKSLEKSLDGVSVEPKTLGELIKHDELFVAYPQLKDISVHFADINERGAYNSVFKEIVLQKSLKLDKSKLSKTLIHEIQHAIQDIEGFAGGSNTEYWRDVGIPESKLREYYEKTAGEIEARDSAQRSWRTDEARKEKRPDIDRTDVVFADDSVIGNSIVEPFTDKAGNNYDTAVLLDTNFFDGISPRNWGRELKKHLVDRSKNNPFILPIVDEIGNVQQLQFAKTNDRVTKNGKSNHKVLDELSSTSDNISKLSVIHIDEIVEISEEKNPYFTTEHKHQWLDEKGWLHRSAHVINAKNGDVFEIVMDIAKTKDGRVVLFALNGKTKKVGNVQVNSLKIKGSGQNSNFDNIVTQYSEKSSGTDTKNRRSIKLTQKSQQVLDENPELKNAFESLQNELGLTKGFVPEGKVIHKYAAQLKKDNPCGMSVAEIESDLREIYSVLSSMSGSEGYEYAADLTLNLAKKMLDSSRVLDDLNAEKKELRQRLTSAVKGHKWYLSPEMRSEIEYHYDSYGNFHKKTFGKGFSFSENSTDYLDSDWAELCAAVPELFDSDTPAVEQPLAIVEAFSATEYEYGLFDDYQYDTQAKYIATDIMNYLAAVPEADTMVGRMKSAEYDRIAKLKSENAEKITDLKKKYAEDIERTSAEEKMHYKLQIKQKIEAEKAAKARKSIETTMVRLSGMLANGTKSRHIPLKLIDTVRELCYSITLNRASQAQLGDNLNKIEALYAALNEGKEDVDGETNNQFLKNAYDEYVHNLIHQLSEQLRHKNIGSMTLEELILVDETVKAVAQRVARGNELHIESRNEGVEETAQVISGELGSAKVKRLYKSDRLNNASDKIDHEKWKFLKPVYAWRMIGSDTFAELMNNIRKGEDTWAVDIAEAREKVLSIGEKYHKDTWADDKKVLTLASGDKFTFSVQQLMMLYVASQREQYIPHLIGHKRGEKVDSMKGGFVFEDAYKVIEDRKGNSKGAKTRAWRKRDAGTHHLTESDLDLFAETLTPEQRNYANEMRDYLAKDLAVKGNEITRQLYDMNKFVEDKYFPIKVAREFLDGNTKEPEVRSVLSTSIMKDLQEYANNPILLRNFDDMWAEHVQQMAMFHSFALPLDDFTRVFNCRSSNGSPASIKSRIETACGKGAVSYIENFIKDVNGGVHASSTPTVMNKALSLFKKGAVFASASVAIQQPSAIARALAEVDIKYFAKTTGTGFKAIVSKKEYNELMRYAPIARVKSMGFFDNSIGQSTKEWLLSREYKGLKNKSVALFKDSFFRDDVLSMAPEKMDEITWCHLWNAVKAETADKYNLSGEELLKKSGERFSEVVELTQVYDSVFSKSEYMRSKDTGAKMSMAFMAEPTTALNMLVDAAANLKHGDKKKGGRYIGAFVASVVLNNILKAFVTAARDDDEEKTYIEKYISSVAGGVATDINPLTLLPFVKDVLSIFNGYSIERADMSLVQDLYEAVESLGSDTESGSDKFINLAGALAAFLGVPVKNVVRDIRATYNFAAGVFGFEKENEDGEKVPVQKNIKETSGEGIINAIKDEFSEGFLNKVKNFAEETFFGTPEEQLYNAIKQGNYKAYEKLLKEEYGGDSAKVNSAIRSGLINYDERVTKAAEARRDGNSTLHSQCVKGLSADGFSNENIRKAVDKVYNELMDDGEEEKNEKAYSLYTYEDLNNAIETGGDVQGIIDDIASAAVQNGKTDEEAKGSIRNQVTSYWKPLYLEASDYEQEEIKKLLDDTELYSDLDETLYGWEKDYTTEKYKSRYLEASRSEKERIISELEDTGLYTNAAKTARGWEVAVLKEEYKSATSQTEKERIKAEIWNTGYYKYYSSVERYVKEQDADE